MEEEDSAVIEIENHELKSFTGVEPKFDINLQHGRFPSTVSMKSIVISLSKYSKSVVCTFLVITCIPFIAGAAFTSIFIEDGNYNAAVVSFFTACLSLGSISLFVFHLLKRLEKMHDIGTLEGLKVLGMIMSVISGISLGVYTILAFFKKQYFDFHGENFFSSAVFSGVCLTTAIQLYITAQWYQNNFKESERLKKMENSQTINSTSSAIN